MRVGAASHDEAARTAAGAARRHRLASGRVQRAPAAGGAPRAPDPQMAQPCSSESCCGGEACNSAGAGVSSPTGEACCSGGACAGSGAESAPALEAPAPAPSAEDGPYSQGYRAGLLVGARTAVQDGARLGRLHGTAFGGELGALEGLTLALAALWAPADADAEAGPSSSSCSGGGSEGGGDGGVPEAASGRAAPRVSRAAAQVQEMVAGLALRAGAPLPAKTDCVDILLRCRARAKVCCAAASLPPQCASLAGWGAGSGAPAAAQRATLDF